MTLVRRSCLPSNSMADQVDAAGLEAVDGFEQLPE